MRIPCRASAVHLALAICAALLSLSALEYSADSSKVLVPGSRKALRRLLPISAGPPDTFLLDLNRSLLETVRSDGDWRRVPRRILLDEYLAAIAELREVLRLPVRLSAGTGGNESQFRKLCKILGYRAQSGRDGLVLKPLEGDQWERRREVARAIAWDPPTILQRLAELPSGSGLTLSIEDETLPFPVSLALLSRIVGRQVDSDGALAEMVEDQNLSLVVEGLERCPVGMRQEFDIVDLRRIYRQMAIPFFRYVSAFEVHAGRLDFPGGERAAALWTGLASASTSQPSVVLRALLRKDAGRGAFFWHSLHFAPDAMVDYLLFGGRSQSATRGAESFYRLYRKLGASYGSDRFDAARGERLGFSALLRSVSVTDDGSSLRLPGGVNVWLEAIKSSKGPTSQRQLDRITARGERRLVGSQTFLLKSLTESVKIGKIRLPALPRIVRIVNLWGGDEELLTAQNIVLLARATELYPGLLESIEQLPIDGPQSLTALLLAVRRMDELGDDVDKFVLVASFQGGLELLAGLHGAERMTRSDLAELLNEWTALHQHARDPKDVGARQLEWLGRLAAVLPEAADSCAGRGPKEKALLQALSPWEDPQTFSFGGLEYAGHRKKDLAEAWSELLKQQAIPSLDDLDAAREALAGLDEALKGARLDESHALATRLLGIIEGLPNPTFDVDLERDEERRFAPTDRRRALKLLERIRGQGKAKRLPKERKNLVKVRALMGREMRPLLLATAYLEAAGEMPSVLLDDPNLIRKHAMVRALERKLRPNPLLDSPWILARVVPSSEGSAGLQIAGYVGTVARAMEDYRVKAAAMGREAGGAAGPLGGSLDARYWRAARPEITRLVSAAMAAGNAVLVRALAEQSQTGIAWRLATERLPTARLLRAASVERPNAVISASERMELGLRAFTSGVSATEDHEFRRDPRFEELHGAIDAAGETWTRELMSIGPPALSLNGRKHSGLIELPVYESLQDDGESDALWERARVDLYLEILNYVGKHQLPAAVAADLHRRILRRNLTQLAWTSSRDWQTFVFWLAELAETGLDEEMRGCLKDGLYTLQLP